MKVMLYLLCIILSAFLHTTALAQEEYTISTAQELVSFCENVNNGNSYEGANVVLSTNIDLSGIDWTPIGTEENPFKGTFDGGSYSMTGITKEAKTKEIGLFAYNEGTVKNLNVSADIIQTGYTIDETRAGEKGEKTFSSIIVIYNNGNIYNCKSSGTLNSTNGSSYAVSGGICAVNKGAVSQCENTAIISTTTDADYPRLYADAYAGGICGINEGTVAECTSSAEITGHSRYATSAAGGICGDNRGFVSNCTTSGAVYSSIYFSVNTSYSYAGGICGSNTGKTDNCSSEASVQSWQFSSSDTARQIDSIAGGICGYSNGEISYCTFTGSVMAGIYWNSNGESYAGGICGYNRGNILSGSFDGVIASSTVISKAPHFAGGITAYNDGGKITYCSSQGSITPNEQEGLECYYGGIAGVNRGNIAFSSSKALIRLNGDDSEISNENSYAGGLLAQNDGRVENCYYFGSGTNNIKSAYVGGIAVKNNGIIENCYAKAAINQSLIKKADGIALENNGSVRYCYYYISQLDETIEGTYKSFAQMRKAETYEKWPFESFWEITSGVNQGLPSLKDIGGGVFAEGDGSSDSPYIIKTERDLYNIRFFKDSTFKIEADIIVNDLWTPIGDETDKFMGKIDGGYHTVTLNNTDSTLPYNGFIGYGEGCKIINLNINSKNIMAQNKESYGVVYCGGVIAHGENTEIRNVKFTGAAAGQGDYVYCGGIAGYATGLMANCVSEGDIKASGENEAVHTMAGGIAGYINGSMLKCRSFANIEASGESAKTGGLCAIGIGKIFNCSYMGEILNTSSAAQSDGIAGLIYGDVRNSDSEILEEGYPVRLREIPKNQNGENITKENVNTSTSITLKLLSQITRETDMYIAFCDERGAMKFVKYQKTALSAGENTVAISDIAISDCTAMQIFIWDDGMIPYSGKLIID